MHRAGVVRAWKGRPIRDPRGERVCGVVYSEIFHMSMDCRNAQQIKAANRVFGEERRGGGCMPGFAEVGLIDIGKATLPVTLVR